MSMSHAYSSVSLSAGRPWAENIAWALIWRPDRLRWPSLNTPSVVGRCGQMHRVRHANTSNQKDDNAKETLASFHPYFSWKMSGKSCGIRKDICPFAPNKGFTIVIQSDTHLQNRFTTLICTISLLLLWSQNSISWILGSRRNCSRQTLVTIFPHLTVVTDKDVNRRQEQLKHRLLITFLHLKTQPLQEARWTLGTFAAAVLEAQRRVSIHADTNTPLLSNVKRSKLCYWQT